MRIGTRGSALALRQAGWTADRLRAAGHEVELVTLTTPGDRGEQVSDKSRWVSELERALLAGEIDLAVHSAKDVPEELAVGTELVAFPEREDHRDALCGAAGLAELPPGARVGTSSLRRAAQLHTFREDLEVVELRGNVDTRLRRLSEGSLDAIVLAMAGLRRLDRAHEAGAALPELVPAPGQGALAVQARAGTPEAAAASELTDPDTATCVNAERALMRRLGATCHTPVGAHARLDRTVVELTAWIGLVDGSEWISDRSTGTAQTVSDALADRLLAVGAADLLERAERELA